MIEIPRAYAAAFDSQHRYLLLRGGAGSGKSRFAHAKALIRFLSEENSRQLALRKTGSTVLGSVFQLFKDIITENDLRDYVDIFKSERTFYSKLNDNFIRCTGMDDSEKIKSVAGLTSILLDEATEFKEEDIDQLDLRLRGETHSYKQMILCFNPVSRKHWIKSKFFDNPDEDVMTLITTYKDNPFLDEQYIKILTQRIAKNELMKQVYVDGMWGDVDNENSFYKHFKLLKHVNFVEYNKNLPLHITFDFNVLPFVTLGVWQIQATIEGYLAIKIDEICLESPYNRTSDACDHFIQKYQTHDAGLIVYGDPSGKSESTRTKAGENDYTIITNKLQAFNPSLRVWNAAPPVKKRGEFIDAIFVENYRGIEIIINERCQKTIEEYMYLKEALDGTKLKKKVKKGNITYEEYGHISDADEYFLTYAFSNEWYEFKNGGTYGIIETGTYNKKRR